MLGINMLKWTFRTGLCRVDINRKEISGEIYPAHPPWLLLYLISISPPGTGGDTCFQLLLFGMISAPLHRASIRINEVDV